jgi:hypothetical protein
MVHATPGRAGAPDNPFRPESHDAIDPEFEQLPRRIERAERNGKPVDVNAIILGMRASLDRLNQRAASDIGGS